MDYSLPGSSVHGDSPGKKTGVGCHAIPQGIFTTQGSNPGLPRCRWILYYCLSHQGSPYLEVSTKSSTDPIPEHLPGQSHNRQTTNAPPPSPFIVSWLPRQPSKSVGLASSKQWRNAGHFLSQSSSGLGRDGQSQLPLSHTPPSSTMSTGPDVISHTFPKRVHPNPWVLPSHLCQRRQRSLYDITSLPCSLGARSVYSKAWL